MSEDGVATGAWDTLADLDTGRWSVLHRLFGSPPRSEPGFLRSCVLPYVATAGATYGPMLVLAAVCLPTLTERTPGGLKLPFLYDVNVAFMFLVTLPLLVVMLAAERRLIPSAVSRIAREGVLKIDGKKAARFRERWERRYGLANLFAQLAGAAIGIGAAVGNYLALGEEGFGAWQADGQFNPAGWAYLLGIFAFYTTVPFFLLRSATTIVFLAGLVKASKLKLVPFHPDKCGGLRPVGAMGLRNQYFIAVGGINVLLMILVVLVFLDLTTGMATLMSGAILAYVLVGPVAFMGPLIPFRKAMVRVKSDLMTHVAQGINDEFGEIAERLVQEKTISKEDEETLARLQRMGEWIQNLPVWPFDASTLTKFLAAYILPLVSLVAAALIGGFIEGLASSLSGL